MNPKPSLMQKTLLLIKPDAVERGLIGTIISRIEAKGLKIVALKFVRLSKSKAEELYAPHKEKSFFSGLVGFITSAPIAAMVLEAPDVINQVRKLMGTTNCAAAEPGTIRGDLGISIQNNLIHGSDSPESAQREIAVFFSDQDMVNYTRTLEHWLSPTEVRV